MTHFRTELCISAQTGRLALFGFLLFVLTFRMLLVNGQIDGHGEGGRQANSSGWLAVRTHWSCLY